MGHIRLPADASYGSRRYRLSKLHLVTVVCLSALVWHYWKLPQQHQQYMAARQERLDWQLHALDNELDHCRALYHFPVQYDLPPQSTRRNPRYNFENGQQQPVVLQNANLFDGESVVNGQVDIHFDKGIVTGIYPSDQRSFYEAGPGALIIDASRYVATPGIVDMHAHHVGTPHPTVQVTDDLNEINPESGPMTPWARALDALKPYDKSATLVAAGGITSSLILPGSANIIGGEAVVIKNVLNSGARGEQVVEELLLEHGVPEQDRRRYVKMACGENPMGLYQHTRMGTAWLFRKEMEKAQTLARKQDHWCVAATDALVRRDPGAVHEVMKDGGFPRSRALDLLIEVLRGKVNVNTHCYEPEDMEAMIRHSREFGFQVKAFHHALEAWRVPEMLKDYYENITIATFSHFSHYKHEALDSSLYAGTILYNHSVNLAYKTDGAEQSLKPPYLVAQAAEGHAFGVPPEVAMQAVTSVPARSLGLDHRIGYVRAGYDADIVLWDRNPLSNGATPSKVFIDGVLTIENKLPKVASSTARQSEDALLAPQMRVRPSQDTVETTCSRATQSGNVVISGIQKVMLPGLTSKSSPTSDLTMILSNGQIACLDTAENCISPAADATHVQLKNGHVWPGLTAIVKDLGLGEITFEDSTGDGSVTAKQYDSPDSLIYAKDGLHLSGPDFARARLGGVTRAVVAPLKGAASESVFLQGVSTAFKVSGKQTVLDGAIVQDDVALHFVFGQGGKTASTPTVSAEIGQLRKILAGKHDEDSVYARVANGSFPLVANVVNHHDMLHLIRIKREFPSIDLILYGAAEAPLVAEQIAAADVPVIFDSLYSFPDFWENKDVLPGPPLSVSPIRVLLDAGVKLAYAQHHFSDSEIHLLGIDAGFAARTAGLTDEEAVDLVSKNLEEILHLDKKRSALSARSAGDFVVYEGNPLEWGSSVVLTVDGESELIVECWPDAA